MRSRPNELSVLSSFDFSDVTGDNAETSETKNEVGNGPLPARGSTRREQSPARAMPSRAPSFHGVLADPVARESARDARTTFHRDLQH